MNRREFLKLGVMSSAALTATSLTATLTGCTDTLPPDSEWKFLRESDRLFFAAIAPVMFKGHVPENPNQRQQMIDTMVRNIDLGAFLQGPHNQKQLRDLLNLLNFGLSRGLTTGVWSRWDQASEEEIDQFLHRWRNSSLSLFNLAYNGLNKLMAVTWYGQPISWPMVGYSGPMFPEQLITRSE